MSVKTPLPEPPWKRKAQGAGAAVLCALALAALLVTALRVRGQKLAARGVQAGDIPPVRFVVGDARAVRLTLRRGEPIRFEDFTLQFRDTVSVRDAKGRPCVEFTRIAKGQVRRWQELQLAFSEVAEDAIAIEAEIGPSAPCFGAGLYTALRTGLRVEFPGKQALTITAWDPVKPELTLRIDREGRAEERTVGDKGEGSVFGLRYRFGRTPAGEPLLDLDSSE